MMLEIYDLDGHLQTWEWLRQKYGPVGLMQAATGPGWRLRALREVVGPACYQVGVLGPNGGPVQGARVARWWKDVDKLLPEDLATWWDKGVWGPTDELGRVAFGTGQGDYYFPQDGDVGATALWVEGVSDCLTNLGTLGGTEHQTLATTFQWEEAGPPDPVPPPPPPEEEDLWDAVVGRLDRIIELLERADW